MLRPQGGRGNSIRHEVGQGAREGLQAVERGGGREHGPARPAAGEKHLRDPRLGDVRRHVRRLHGRHGGIFQGAVCRD